MYCSDLGSQRGMNVVGWVDVCMMLRWIARRRLIGLLGLRCLI